MSNGGGGGRERDRERRERVEEREKGRVSRGSLYTLQRRKGKREEDEEERGTSMRWCGVVSGEYKMEPLSHTYVRQAWGLVDRGD